MDGRWIPEIARREPERLRYRYRVLIGPVLPVGWQWTVAEALAAARVEWQREGDATWKLLLPWSTRVMGVVRREVEEQVELRVVATTDSAHLELDCLPVATHAAHAAGLAGVVVVAAMVWLVGGWTVGLPGGLTTALAGGLWADAMRELALERLERRLRRLAEDLGIALWPNAPAEMLPPRPRPTLLHPR